MPEITVTHIVLLALSAIIGLIVGWVIRGSRIAEEKAAINAGWNERIAAQDLTEEQRQAIDALSQESGPTLGYAYGETDRIVFAAKGTMNLLEAGLPGLLGLGMSFDMDNLVHSIITRTGALDGAES